MPTAVASSVPNTMKSSTTMRALVFHGPNQIAVESVPIPRPGVGEAVIRITLTTICGTDVHILG
jgi:threonine dehydrogenase-like Zn-dependent dehydrogenase